MAWHGTEHFPPVLALEHLLGRHEETDQVYSAGVGSDNDTRSYMIKQWKPNDREKKVEICRKAFMEWHA